jgi:hypothetical protein
MASLRMSRTSSASLRQEGILETQSEKISNRIESNQRGAPEREHHEAGLHCTDDADVVLPTRTTAVARTDKPPRVHASGPPGPELLP